LHFILELATSAATAGLQQGDIMIVVDDERITSQSTISGRISQHNIGDVISLKVLRPSSYQINVGNIQLEPPYTSMTFNVPIELCAQ
jgi:S1-C subfamily serine protease